MSVRILARPRSTAPPEWNAMTSRAARSSLMTLSRLRHNGGCVAALIFILPKVDT